MSKIAQRVAYLKGLAEGSGISDETKEGKLILKMLDVLDDMSQSINELEGQVDNLNEFVDDMDEDLTELSDVVYGADEDDDEDEDGLIHCDACGEDFELDDECFNDEDQLVCPACGEKVQCSCCCDDEDCSCQEDEEKK